MHTLRIRVTGAAGTAEAIIEQLHGMPKVDRVEEVADQMHRRDDTSSLGLAGDGGGDFHDIEVHVTSDAAADAIRDGVEGAACELGAAVEFLREF
jgi:hypothetical protein